MLPRANDLGKVSVTCDYVGANTRSPSQARASPGCQNMCTCEVIKRKQILNLAKMHYVDVHGLASACHLGAARVLS